MEEPATTITEEDLKEIESQKPTPEQVKLRNEAFMSFWESIKHLQHDPDFERLPIPYNYNVILDMIYKQIDEEEGLAKLSPPEIEKYNETKEELKEKYQNSEEKEPENKKNKKKKNKKS